MPKIISIEELKSRAPKKQLEKFYSDHTLAETCSKFHLSQKQLNSLFETYKIHKRTYEESKALNATESKFETVEPIVAPEETTNLTVEHVEQTVTTINTSSAYSIEDFFSANAIVFEKDVIVDTIPFDFAIYVNHRLKLLVDYFDSNLDYSLSYDVKYANIKQLDVLYMPFIAENNEYCEKELLRLLKIDVNQFILDTYYWCRETDFPMSQYSDEFLKSCFLLLKENSNKSEQIADNLLTYFHPSIWKCNKKNKISPADAWLNDKLLIACIRNRALYKGNNVDRSRILSGFTNSQMAQKVDVFSLTLAKQLISDYLSEFSTIFDPFSGFSERLLASCLLNKNYIGQDINESLVSEANNLINYFDLSAKLVCKNSITEKAEYECMFTCVPNKDSENYRQNIPTFTCDEWIDKLLLNYKCKRYLLLVDETLKYGKNVIATFSNKKLILIDK